MGSRTAAGSVHGESAPPPTLRARVDARLDAYSEQLPAIIPVAILGLAAVLLVVELQSDWAAGWTGGDYRGYLEGARRFLDTGTPFTSDQVSGSWTVRPDSFIHPPTALPLFVAFLWLPSALWWALPLGFTGAAIAWLRPARWTWPLMAGCLCWPRSATYVIAGNTDMWVMAAIAAGAVWGWPAVLAAIKPTLFPVALPFATRRSWWVAAVVLAALTLPFLELWRQWWIVVSTSPFGPAYSAISLPLVVVPLIAWLGRRSTQRSPQPE